MTAELQQWWRLRTMREQRLILVMVALVALTILWFGILRPLDDRLADARQRHGRAVLAEADARGQAEAIREFQQRRPPRLDLPVRVFAPQSASASGFTVRNADPFEPDGVALNIDAARPGPLFDWVSDLQGRGLIVETLQATANADRTVSVRIAVRQAGR